MSDNRQYADVWDDLVASERQRLDAFVRKTTAISAVSRLTQHYEGDSPYPGFVEFDADVKALLTCWGAIADAQEEARPHAAPDNLEGAGGVAGRD